MQAGAACNPAERQKRIKLDQLNLNVDKALVQLRGVKQQVAEANAELLQAHSELATMHASTVQAVQEVRATGANFVKQPNGGLTACACNLHDASNVWSPRNGLVCWWCDYWTAGA
jgi:hypothetical protein